jgi:WD40 repeat protein
VHIFNHHKADVLGARWNPNIESLFASYGADRKVNVWDTSKIGTQMSVTDAEEGPAELLVKIINNNLISLSMVATLLKFQTLIGTLA